MTGLSQHTQVNSPLKQSAGSMVSRAWGYVTNLLSNRRWALKLERIEKELNDKLADFGKKSVALVKRKAALAEKQQALGKMFAEIKAARVRLQCAQDTFRAEQPLLREKIIADAKGVAQLECDAIRQRSVKALEEVDLKIEQRQAELLALETKLSNLRDMLAGVTETLGIGLRDCAGVSDEVVVCGHAPIYLVPKQDGENVRVEAADDWTPSLFAAEQRSVMSSAAVISSAACLSLRVGG